MIDDLSQEVEELMRVLERKKKEREMHFLEKQVHERKIDEARLNYKGELIRYENELSKVNQKLKKNINQKTQLDKDLENLNLQETTFTAQLDTYSIE